MRGEGTHGTRGQSQTREGCAARTHPNPNPNPNPNEVKFALVSWVGEEVAPMRKARLSSLRGQASSVLSPYHTELLNVASAAEVTHEAIMKQLEA